MGSCERAKLDEFLSRLDFAKANLQSAPLFVATIREAAVLFSGLTDDALAHRFGMSRTTASRWRHGTAAPHPQMRKTVYRYLKTLAARELVRAERQELENVLRNLLEARAEVDQVLAERKARRAAKKAFKS